MEVEEVLLGEVGNQQREQPMIHDERLVRRE
jgi:hypothetical protein